MIAQDSTDPAIGQPPGFAPVHASFLVMHFQTFAAVCIPPDLSPVHLALLVMHDTLFFPRHSPKLNFSMKTAALVVSLLFQTAIVMVLPVHTITLASCQTTEKTHQIPEYHPTHEFVTFARTDLETPR
jgi:hypothetical protein